MKTKRHQVPRSEVVAPSKPRLWRVLGPGLITGAADDDPSGIATYSQAGAQYGFQLSWTLLLSYPLMVVVQEISARIGRTTGLGIAGNLRQHYPKWLLEVLVGLLFVANTLNIGADLGAMADATRLLVPGPPAWLYIAAYSLFCIVCQVFLNHTRYVSVLKWLTLALFSYFAVLLFVKVPWATFMKGLLLPTMQLNRDSLLVVVAILGTTISPYLFFWQASQEVEETKAHPRRQPLRRNPKQGTDALSRIRLDTMVGMAFSNLVALSILVAAAATLHAAGIHEVSTAAQAATALKPLAGSFAFAIFALGIIGTGLLAVPVLAGSAAYAIGEAGGWPVGLSRGPLQAKAFYAVIAIATILGALGNVFSISPLKALVWAAVINGVVAVPVMVLLMVISANPRVMGKFCVSGAWRVTGWIATCVMAAATLAFVVATTAG